MARIQSQVSPRRVRTTVLRGPIILRQTFLAVPAQPAVLTVTAAHHHDLAQKSAIIWQNLTSRRQRSVMCSFVDNADNRAHSSERASHFASRSGSPLDLLTLTQDPAGVKFGDVVRQRFLPVLFDMRPQRRPQTTRQTNDSLTSRHACGCRSRGPHPAGANRNSLLGHNTRRGTSEIPLGIGVNVTNHVTAAFHLDDLTGPFVAFKVDQDIITGL